MAAPASVVKEYLDAFTSGRLEDAYGKLSEDFSFRGPILQSDGKDTFIEGSKGLAPIVRGYKPLREFQDGNDVCMIYEFHVETPKGRGSVVMSEWSTVRNGKIVSSRVLFDTAAFQELM